MLYIPWRWACYTPRNIHMSVSERTSERMNDGKYMTQGGGQQMKKGKNSALRSRAMMYVNQVRHSPYKDVDSLQNKIDSDIHPKRYAIINHNKDVDGNGKRTEDNWHVMFEFQNPRYLNSIAKLLGEKDQFIQIWDKGVNNGFSYLTHRTDDSKDKYQYDPSEVTANFDYPKFLKDVSIQVTRARKRTNAKNKGKTDQLLDALYEGKIQKTDVEDQLKGSQYGKIRKQIDDVDDRRLRKEAEDFREHMLKNKIPLETIWLFGGPGTGKTTLAKEIAKKKGNPFFVSGSSRDIFQNYKGEHTIILDDLRPKFIEYSDLLRITDPYSPSTMAPSRYRDKYLACDLIIITSPFSPLQFYCEDFHIAPQDMEFELGECVDSFGQLKRRILLTIYITDMEFCLAEYDPISKSYNLVPNTAKNNPYSSAARQTNTTIDRTDLYNKMFP